MFLYSQWRSIPLATRQTIAAAFDIKKSLPTHVVNNVVENDGYQIAEIEGKLTVEAMAAYLNVPLKTDPTEMWTMLVDKAEERETVPTTPVPQAPIDEVKEALDNTVSTETPTPAKRGRKPRAQ